MVGNIHIMGIVNLTPDSFYAGSCTGADLALPRILAQFEEGADVVDLGACSTRPGASQPNVEEEWKRLEPVLRSIVGYTPSGDSGRFAPSGPSHCLARPLRERPASGPLPLPLCGGAQAPEGVYPTISLDTYRSEIVQRAYDIIGPFMVNDVGGGELDSHMLETVGRLELPYVAMCPDCATTEEIIAWFREFSVKAEDNGIREWILDPGFGFGKTLDQNYEVLDRLEEIVSAFPQPILAGVSRKSMIYKKLGITPDEALPGTQVIQFAALEKGATWLRVHDVLPAVNTAKLYTSLFGAARRNLP